MDMQQGHAAWTRIIDMHHGQQHGQAAWISSMDKHVGRSMEMLQGHAART